MNLEELFKNIDDDLTLSHTNLQDKIYEIPKLHNKYLRLFFDTKNKLNKKQIQIDILYKETYMKFKNENEILDKKQIEFHILSDTDYSKLNYELKKLNNLVDVLEKTVKRVNNMSFDIKSIIDYLTFIQAG